MNCDVKLTAEEFKVLHNSLWELSNIDHPKVAELVERIRSQALASAYEQDNRAFETKHDHYDEIRRSQGFQSIWSIYSVDDLHDSAGVFGATRLVYKSHWGPQPVIIDIDPDRELRWIDLYELADQAIAQSGDQHHMFIESISVTKGSVGVLELQTGS